MNHMRSLNSEYQLVPFKILLVKPVLKNLDQKVRILHQNYQKYDPPTHFRSYNLVSMSFKVTLGKKARIKYLKLGIQIFIKRGKINQNKPLLIRLSDKNVLRSFKVTNGKNSPKNAKKFKLLFFANIFFSKNKKENISIKK